MSYHAKLSPSGSPRWTSCTESPRQSAGIPSASSAASRPGTACHQAGGECLEDGVDPSAFRYRVMGFPRNGDEGWIDELPRSALDDLEHEHMMSDLDVAAVRTYVDYVRAIHAKVGGTLIVEQDVPIDHITGEPGATGRSDAIIIAPPVIFCIDAKFGKKKVRAYDVVEPAGFDPMTGQEIAEQRRMNLQLAMYMLGALRKHGAGLDIRQARGVIVQPLLDSVAEYEAPISDLLALASWLSDRAEATRSNPQFAPTFENCLFCSAKVKCPARSEVLMSKAVEGFDDVPETPTVETIDFFN